jgi:hypothetical protein
MDSSESTFKLTDCSFTSCSTTIGTDYYGGALYLSCLNASIVRCDAFHCKSGFGQFAFLDSSADNQCVFSQSSCHVCAPRDFSATLSGACDVRSQLEFAGRFLNFTQCYAWMYSSPCVFVTGSSWTCETIISLQCVRESGAGFTQMGEGGTLSCSNFCGFDGIVDAAVMVEHGDMKVDGCAFADNKGDILVENGTVTVINCWSSGSVPSGSGITLGLGVVSGSEFSTLKIEVDSGIANCSFPVVDLSTPEQIETQPTDHFHPSHSHCDSLTHRATVHQDQTLEMMNSPDRLRTDMCDQSQKVPPSGIERTSPFSSSPVFSHSASLVASVRLLAFRFVTVRLNHPNRNRSRLC